MGMPGLMGQTYLQVEEGVETAGFLSYTLTNFIGKSPKTLKL